MGYVLMLVLLLAVFVLVSSVTSVGWAALMTAGVGVWLFRRNIRAGTVGLFIYLTWAVIRYFGDTLGVPVALLLVGALFIGLAVVAARLRRLTLPPGPAAMPAAS